MEPVEVEFEIDNDEEQGGIFETEAPPPGGYFVLVHYVG